MKLLSRLLVKIRLFIKDLFRDPYEGKTYVFALMGQSNMVGYNSPASRDVNPRIKCFTLNDTLEIADDVLFKFPSKYYELYGTTGNKQEFNNIGTSPGYAFAKNLLPNLKYNDEIILVPSARGGSFMTEQILDDLVIEDAFGNKQQRKRSLLKVAIERVKKAMNSGKNTVFGGVLFFQGEADFLAYTHFRTENSKLNLDYWGDGIQKMKTEFKNNFGSCNFIFAQIADYPLFRLKEESRSWIDKEMQNFRDEQQRISIKTNTPMIITKDISMEGSMDGIHLPALAQYEVGKRFAQKYVESFGVAK